MAAAEAARWLLACRSSRSRFSDSRLIRYGLCRGRAIRYAPPIRSAHGALVRRGGCGSCLGCGHPTRLAADSHGRRHFRRFGLRGPWLQLKPSLPCTLMGKQIGRSEVRELGLQLIGGGVPPRFVRAALTPLPQSAPFAPLGLHQEKRAGCCSRLVQGNTACSRQPWPAHFEPVAGPRGHVCG